MTRHKKVLEAIAGIPESEWVDIDYTIGGHAQVAETIYTTGTRGKQRQVRLVVRRTRLTEPAQRKLWPDWRHHAFITNTVLPAVEADEFHRDYAVVELAIRDLKDGGLEHVPSGHFHANGAWLAAVVLAHNLNRWATALCDQAPMNNRTMRTRITAIAAVLVNRSGRLTLRFPTRWP